MPCHFGALTGGKKKQVLDCRHNPRPRFCPGWHMHQIPVGLASNSCGRSSDFRIILLPTPSRLRSGILWGSFPVTAAGPCRIFTGFPVYLEGHTTTVNRGVSCVQGNVNSGNTPA